MTDTSRRPFLLFVAGALLYFAAAAIAGRLVKADDPLATLEWLMPAFGLPYLLLGRRRGWRTALYFLLLVPAIHYAAVFAAIESTNGRGSGWLPGATGGLVGSFLSFAALLALGLARPRSAPLMGFGIVLLTLLGAIGVSKMDAFAGTALDDEGLLLVLYLPWQIVFGFLLSRLLRAPADIGLVAEPAPA
jgi:hypothetical protein